MAQKDNIKALFSNTKTRLILLLTVLVIIIAVVIAFFQLRGTTEEGLDEATRLQRAPGTIRSIPGQRDPTQQYAELVEQRNIEQAMQARDQGGSAIPTIIRTQAFGEGVDVVGPAPGEGGLGFTTLAREDMDGTQKSLWLQSLRDANCNKQTVSKVMAEGATLKELREVCSCAQLHSAGIEFHDLRSVCPCGELRMLGFTSAQMKQAGMNASQLRECGYSACELKGAGFTAQEMLAAGFSHDELRGAGFPDAEIELAGGLPSGVSADEVRRAGCNPEALRALKARGVSASAIRRISGCSVNQLKAAGFNAQDLKNAGFSAAELARAGFTPEQLRAAYNARELLDAGFSADDLAKAGFSPSEIAQGQASLPPEVTPGMIKEAGCDSGAIKRLRLAGVSAQQIREHADCSAAQLKKGGFSEEDLKNAGFTPAQIDAPLDEVSSAKISEAECDVEKLSALREQGISAREIREQSGCSIDDLKRAGFNAKDLSDAGFSPDELLNAGFTPEQLASAGLNPTAAIATGRTADCSVASLRAAKAMGTTAATIKKTLGCSVEALKAAGYSAEELKDAGFSAKELKDAGYSLGELKAAGFNARDLKAAGYTADDLLKAGFTPEDLKNADFSAKELKEAGVSDADIKKLGFSDEQLKEAGLLEEPSAVAALPPPPARPVAPSTMPPMPGASPAQAQVAAQAQAQTQQLQEILKRQQAQMADQRSQQKLQQRIQLMQNYANQSLTAWKNVATQVFIASSIKEEDDTAKQESKLAGIAGQDPQAALERQSANGQLIVKTGDVMFGVIDTSVNSDEPGPILATIVSGKLKGGKLIGSFNLPSNADKMVITFNTLSMPGIARTISVQAYAIDPNTARTALSSVTNHHYLQRYGSLFASTFLEGFGNAFQAADTTISIGGTGGVTNTTVQSGIGRSILENAVIGLATLGKAWGQFAQQQMNRPTTVEVCSGTGVGLLFTQDVVVG